MQQEPRNYGRAHDPGDAMDGSGDEMGRYPYSAMSPEDERTWSMLSHLSVLAALVGLMPLGALLVWLVYKDRSPRVGFHALQALWYQVAWLVIFVVAGLMGFFLTVITLGLAIFLVIPAGVLLGLVPIVHGCYAAYKVYSGEDYRYPFIADRIDGTNRAI